MEKSMELLERFAAGDPSAFETLFRQFQGEVYRWIVRITRDPVVAEDLTIETFWRIHRARSRFDSSRSFEAWARVIATNLAVGYLKSPYATKLRPIEEAGQDRPVSRGGGLCVAIDPAVTLEIRQRTQLALEHLPPKLRVVATLALVEDLPLAEIAAALGISLTATKVRLFRAVRILRKKLADLRGYS
jgi:RNA polymerase sigma factor (sigma-70 family)